MPRRKKEVKPPESPKEEIPVLNIPEITKSRYASFREAWLDRENIELRKHTTIEGEVRFGLSGKEKDIAVMLINQFMP